MRICLYGDKKFDVSSGTAGDCFYNIDLSGSVCFGLETCWTAVKTVFLEIKKKKNTNKDTSLSFGNNYEVC